MFIDFMCYVYFTVLILFAASVEIREKGRGTEKYMGKEREIG